MEKEFFATKTEPAVSVTGGKVRGYRYDGVYTFLGIPYGQAKRFGMPEDPAPWEGMLDATIPGFNCPAINHTQAKDGFPHSFWLENENCLNVNVWTPSLDTTAKKPVLVWLHGGAFSYGSPLRQPAYEGSALAQYGDVVVVSITNRLNIFGFMDLSAFGEAYRNSGNAGVADLVLAMKWIQRNIAAFGGNPENVTICGQSGGGGKVTALMQCPDADGTFHKALVMSGVGFKSLLTNTTAQAAKAMLKELGAAADDVSPLEELPTAELVRLYKKVLPTLKEQGVASAFSPIDNGYFDGPPCPPVGAPFAFSKRAKQIPVVIGSTFTEMNLSADLPDPHALTEAEMLQTLRGLFGDDTDKLVALFRKAYPDKAILNLGYLDAMVRSATYRFLDDRLNTCDAPTWVYLFTPEIQFNGGVPAWHSSDMAYLFHNTAITPVANIPGVSDRLERQYADMWVQFARTGNPSGDAFDEPWRPFTAGDPAVMRIDVQSGMRGDGDRELVEMINARHANLLAQNMKKRPTMVGV